MKFYQLLGDQDGLDMWKDTRDLLKGIPAPQVEVYCWHGINVPTTEKLIYSSFPNPWFGPKIKRGNGDGTVNLRSMQACLKWRKEQAKPVHYRSFDDTDHAEMITDDEPVKGVVEVIREINSKSRGSNSNTDATKTTSTGNANRYVETNLLIRYNEQRFCRASQWEELCWYKEKERIELIPEIEIIRR